MQASECFSERVQPQRPHRIVVDGAVSERDCRLLAWLADALGRPAHIAHVDAVTTYELARCAPQLVPLVARARHAALTAAEAAFGREAELYVEWSGVLAWRAGAEIGWHHDANRDYLAQRAFAVLVYLDDQGASFTGGTLRFRPAGASGGGGDAATVTAVAPRRGRLVAYGAGPADAHCVDRVARGARRALTVWLTDDPAHAEDPKILRALAPGGAAGAGLPSTMWRVPLQQQDGGNNRATASGGTSGGDSNGGSGGTSGDGSGYCDARAARLERLGLKVLLPDGVEGRAGLASCGDSNSGAPATVWWSDGLQQASWVAHFVAHGLHDGLADGDAAVSRPRPLAPSRSAVAAAADAVAGNPTDPSVPPGPPAQGWTRPLLESASRGFDALMGSCREELERLLPIWRSHGFLVSD